MAKHDYDEIERHVADAGMPGLAALSALSRRLNGTEIAAANVAARNPEAIDASARARSRLFLYTGSQR